MTPQRYRYQRRLLGSQVQVAKLLGVSRETIVRRENGKQAICREAWLAINAIPLSPRPPQNPTV